MATDQPPPPKKEKKGLKKIWKKVKDFFKDNAAKPAATSSTAPPVPSTAAIPAPTPSTSKPEAATTTGPDDSIVRLPNIEVDDTVEDIPVTPQEPVQPRPIQPSSETGQLTEPEMRFNKAQAIFAKYNLELSEADWDMRPKVPYERVAKNIRMRVRYTCHNCSTTFGHERVCVGCEHRRCVKCSRYPPKKDKSKSQKTDPTALPQTSGGPSSSNTDAACHECQTGFTAGTEECPNCHHKICERCLQEAIITVEHTPDALGTGQKHSTEGVGAAS
ncbi:hypothetical protein LTR84_009897 [Exophiala bonariae]|uniref:FYVE-type domain-containing protein n=1 Tax=Exophiala bonariae TaxID=1690606 RepID=A0AAV9NM28_9EURO|nr:hypothetical protein LTR84_009897 [Exophiala bonariae]